MLLTLKNFSDIVLEFLKILAILVLVSYKPVSYRKKCVDFEQLFLNTRNLKQILTTIIKMNYVRNPFSFVFRAFLRYK